MPDPDVAPDPGGAAGQTAPTQLPLGGAQDYDGPPPGPELAALAEALLLVAPGPATLDELARGAGVPVEAMAATLTELDARGAHGRGWVIQRHNETVQLATAPRFASQVRRFLGLDREARLSAAALETLAIVAYQQPVTRAEVEAVRGVDCTGVLATLHGRGLVEAVGRLASVGNPIQYGTTPDFLRHFGLGSLADLPPLGTVDGRDARDALTAAVAAAEEPGERQDKPVPSKGPNAADGAAGSAPPDAAATEQDAGTA
jgi:segregation and condensation protein B